MDLKNDFPHVFCSKIDCKEQNGYSIKPDLGAATPGWGAPVRPSACTPDMSRYTPSSDQAARDRAWMNTCSSLTAAAQAGYVGPPGGAGQSG
jgi:hypothetical protein